MKIRVLIFFKILIVVLGGCLFINGEWNYFDGNGNLIMTKNFKNGKMHGVFVEYNSQGDTILIEY